MASQAQQQKKLEKVNPRARKETFLQTGANPVSAPAVFPSSRNPRPISSDQSDSRGPARDDAHEWYRRGLHGYRHCRFGCTPLPNVGIRHCCRGQRLLVRHRPLPLVRPHGLRSDTLRRDQHAHGRWLVHCGRCGGRGQGRRVRAAPRQRNLRRQLRRRGRVHPDGRQPDVELRVRGDQPVRRERRAECAIAGLHGRVDEGHG
mmetsp:Transcript_77136/g.221688  ORF Transcript_77136/g.221688 Transcript_77136/m.221688 type:complete len:203 (-) Transcript_77136:1307-1915(-)